MTLREVIPLSEGWHFKESEKPDAAYLPVGQFPTNVHLDLLHHGLIPDPYMGKNELQVQWVGEKVWVYRVAFATPKKAAAAVKAVLAFDGLDTFATVVLNGKTILETDNMFIPERVDVTDVLEKEEGKENELVITFDSAYLRGWKLVEEHPDHKWGCWNGDSSRLAVRKTQYHWVSPFEKLDWQHSTLTNNLNRAGIGVLPCCLAVHGGQSTWKSTSLASRTCIPKSKSMIPSSLPRSPFMRL